MPEDKTSEDLNKEIKSLNEVINDLSKNNLEGFNKIIEAAVGIEAKKEDASDLAKEVLGKMKSIADDNRKNTAGERRKSIKEIESLQRSIKLEKDESTKELIQSQLKALKATTADNSKFLERTTGFLVSHLSEIGGVITGVLADSPILAVGADFLIRKVQGAFAEKRSALDDERERAESVRDNLIGQQVEMVQNADEPGDDSGLTDSNVEVMNNTTPVPDDSIGEGNENRNSLLVIISEQLSEILGTVAPLVDDSEENAREGKVFNDKLLSALKGGKSSVEKVEDNDVSTSVFGAIIASKFIAPLIGVLASIGGIIKGFMLGLGKVFLKVLSKVFLPIAIIGGLFFGITEAIETFKRTGSMKEAFIGFLGGILDFISFGLIGTDELKSFGGFIQGKMGAIFDTIASLFDYIVNPLKKLNNIIKNTFGFDLGLAAGDILKSISIGLGKLLLFMIDKIPFASKILPEALINSIEQMAGEKLGASSEILQPVEKNGGNILRVTREQTERIKEDRINENQNTGNSVAAIDNSVVNNSQNNSIITRPSARNDFAPLTN